jgi:hypothetical protein
MRLLLVPDPEWGTWYMFSNRTRGLIKCVRTDGGVGWLGEEEAEAKPEPRPRPARFVFPEQLEEVTEALEPE